MKHILWDWNGTLLDDTEAALDTLNIMLKARGRDPIGMDFYRDHFAFPCRPFYDSIGLEIPDSEWDALALEYHDIYLRHELHLNAEAIAALEFAKANGARQSIVSALRQDLLEKVTAAFGVAKYMTFICGVDNLDGASKLDRAKALAEELDSLDEKIVIGDALHDKEVADAIGARCVLCGQGSHSAWRLAAVAPTGNTLMESVRLAIGL